MDKNIFKLPMEFSFWKVKVLYKQIFTCVIYNNLGDSVYK